MADREILGVKGGKGICAEGQRVESRNNPVAS